MEVISSSEKETIEIGRKLGKSLKGNEVICLLGELGAGKTTLVKGIAQGMGLLEEYQVRSPTFTIVNEYPTQKGRLIHIDLYRVDDFDIKELIGQGVLVIEWARNINYCDITISIEFVPQGRLIKIR